MAIRERKASFQTEISGLWTRKMIIHCTSYCKNRWKCYLHHIRQTHCYGHHLMSVRWESTSSLTITNSNIFSLLYNMKMSVWQLI